MTRGSQTLDTYQSPDVQIISQNENMNENNENNSLFAHSNSPSKSSGTMTNGTAALYADLFPNGKRLSQLSDMNPSAVSSLGGNSSLWEAQKPYVHSTGLVYDHTKINPADIACHSAHQ